MWALADKEFAESTGSECLAIKETDRILFIDKVGKTLLKDPNVEGIGWVSIFHIPRVMTSNIVDASVMEKIFVENYICFGINKFIVICLQVFVNVAEIRFFCSQVSTDCKAR